MVDVSGGPSLSQALSVKTKLAHLNLDGNLIGASGAASLSQVFPVSTTLTHLNLGSKETGEPGAASLSLRPFQSIAL